jgi:hypothetical protein
MTVDELLSRIASSELTEQMAYDILEHQDATTPPEKKPAAPRAGLSYDELEKKLDSLWEPA